MLFLRSHGPRLWTGLSTEEIPSPRRRRGLFLNFPSPLAGEGQGEGVLNSFTLPLSPPVKGGELIGKPPVEGGETKELFLRSPWPRHGVIDGGNMLIKSSPALLWGTLPQFPSPLRGEGQGEGEKRYGIIPPHLNPLPRRGEED